MVPWYAVCSPLTSRKLVTGGRDDARRSRCLQLQNQELRLQKLSQQLLMALGTRLIPVENWQRKHDFSLRTVTIKGAGYKLRSSTLLRRRLNFFY
jgi:hypothetical protein